MKIVNVVAIVELSTPIGLERLASAIQDTRYAESEARWLKMRLQPEGYYIAFYKSGKFLITGVKSVKEASRVADRVLVELKSKGITVGRKRLSVKNIVATESLELTRTLERLIYSLDPRKALYEPEQFPGLVYKDWGLTFLIFGNGRVVLTGFREEGQAKKALVKLRETLRTV